MKQEMYPKGWNEALSGLVREFLREAFSREQDLAVFSLDKVGDILENAESADAATPELQQSLERCKSLYGELLFAMEAQGITGALINSVRELSQWRANLDLPEVDEENTGSIDMREERKKFLTPEKLSVFAGGEVDDVEQWLKNQVSLPPSAEEFPAPEEEKTELLGVSHGNISIAAPIEQGEPEEIPNLSDTSEFSVPDLAPQADRPVMRLVPPSDFNDTASDAPTETFFPTPAAPPLLSDLPPGPETTAGDYLSLAAHFHQTTQGFETALPPRQAERLEIQSLCLAVSAANEPRAREVIEAFLASRVEWLPAVTAPDRFPVTLLASVTDSLDGLALAQKMAVPWATVTQTLRFLSKVRTQTFEPSLVDTACLLLLFGHDTADENHTFYNSLGVSGIDSAQCLRLGLVLVQLQRYKTRSLSHVVEWAEAEVNQVRGLAEEALDSLEKLTLFGKNPRRAQGG